MKFIDEYRDLAAVQKYRDQITNLVTRPWTIMEVCGGQTHAIVKFGIDTLLPPEISPSGIVKARLSSADGFFFKQDLYPGPYSYFECEDCSRLQLCPPVLGRVWGADLALAPIGGVLVGKIRPWAHDHPKRPVEEARKKKKLYG